MDTLAKELDAPETVDTNGDHLPDANSVDPHKRGRPALSDTVEISPSFTAEQLDKIKLQTARTVGAFQEMFKTWVSTDGETSKKQPNSVEPSPFLFVLDFSPQPERSSPNLLTEAHWEAYRRIRALLGFDDTPPISRGGNPKTSPAINETHTIPGTELSLMISPVIGGRLEPAQTDSNKPEIIYTVNELYTGALVAPSGFKSASRY